MRLKTFSMGGEASATRVSDASWSFISMKDQEAGIKSMDSRHYHDGNERVKRTTRASSLFVGLLSVALTPSQPTATAFIRSGDKASPKRASFEPQKSMSARPLPLSFVSR